MPNVKINGIILAENNMGDYDKMLTMLTPNYGKISCAAKGARRPNDYGMAHLYIDVKAVRVHDE